jgi:hypothetical protein
VATASSVVRAGRGLRRTATPKPTRRRCSSPNSRAGGPILGAVALAQAATGAQSRPLVDRWQAVRTCQGLVLALKKFGLAPLAPTVVGDYFPNQHQPPWRRRRTCVRARSRNCTGISSRATGSSDRSTNMHSRLTTGPTVRMDPRWRSAISDVRGSFRFRVQGKTLMLTPLLTPGLKKEALADPLNFHTAGWMVAVSYFGHPWGRVACGKWC